MRDVISLSAFPKSGVTYLGFLMFHCLFGDVAEIGDLERKYVIDIHAWPALRFAVPQGPRIVKSHFPFGPDSPGVGRTAKAVYLIRHPIDVMMSAWDYRRFLNPGATDDVDGGPADGPAFRHFVRRWLATGGEGFEVAGSWLRHVRSWLDQREIPVHLVTYTDLVDHPGRELAAILRFLDLPVPAERQAMAVESSGMAAMAALEAEEVRHRRTGVFYRPELARSYEGGRRFINKGHRGCYATLLTDEERGLADQTFGAELSAYFPGAGAAVG
ncbi:hypothetical protein TSH100_01120 [Azospirillum sp. TSH100]|uniref:sulfotransferase domain-containing protein n=1 Tax=Azospirillum sp. TSH100 TaxID=652764 RepID=UPI000D610FE8|nr:sulfotransferase domain-containing protein [Azospirillum sp. TSH100]PWC91501.1 hypothetical protein TSH100_01120 [Azospirillum sp. TSH100]QCG89061.1 sulfotransferase domain-containing protein [Azospirillum sp. TSH100]